MKNQRKRAFLASLLTFAALACPPAAWSDEQSDQGGAPSPSGHPGRDGDEDLLSQGRHIFRFDTFGDESFWGDSLKLHEAIEGGQLGGVGPGVNPKTALAVGLKVDVDALPQAVIEQLRLGRIDLNDPATTLTLLQLNAVVGLTGFFARGATLRSIGIQCALCHSTVDDSLAPGIAWTAGPTAT
jgi:hypothetical protein